MTVFAYTKQMEMHSKNKENMERFLHELGLSPNRQNP